MNNFRITYNKEENKIYIKSYSKIDVTVSIFDWNTTTNDINLIYNTTSNFNFNTIWYSTTKNLYDLNGIKIEIKENNKIIKEEYFRFRTKSGTPIDKIALLVQNEVGVGDNLTVTPVIRKMFNIYNQKITIFTYVPDAFINNPYVEKIIKIERGNDSYFNDIPKEYLNEYKILPILNINAHWRAVDHRQVSAWNLGFELVKDELKMDFFPDPYIKIENLPDKYICINPSITNSERTWNSENWQKLISLLEKHIPIVAIGKTTHYDKTLLKTFSDLKITNGINLLNHKSQETLSQAYHIISKSETFVTMNNGLYILALCTDNNITELATPWNTENNFRIRDGIKNHNMIYVEGNCKLTCHSNLKVAINETGDTNILKSGICYLGKDEYECHPTPEAVYEKILEKIITY